jgi:hypothetical protein
MEAGLWRRLPLLCAGFLFAVACGSSSDDGPPDSGYGAAQAVPSAISCDALCARDADCFEHLCNEDTASTRYTGLGSVIAGQCKATCTDALLMSRINAQAWNCFFQSTCRAVFSHDACQAQATYQCQ